MAEQLARGATPGDPEAVGWLVRAAREAAARSPAVAAELLGRASSLAGPADPGRDRLAVERAGALLQAGAIDEAAALCRALLALHRDDLPAAEAAAARAADELAAGSPRYRSHRATWVRALLLEAGGAVPEADAALAGVWDWCRRSGFALEYPVLGPDLVRLALAAGDRERATRVAAAVAEVAAGSAVPWITGAALRCRGLAAGDPGLLRAAVAAYAAGPRPLELALAAEDAGAALARHGDPAAATSLLRQVLAGYERLDAARPAARAEAALRRLGSGAAPAAPAAAPRSAGGA